MLKTAQAEGDPTQLTVWTLLVDGVDPVLRLADAGAEAVGETRRAGEVGLLLGADATGGFLVSVWPTKDEGVFHLIGTAPVTDDRWKKVERWVRRAAPAIVPVFLNESELLDICAGLSEYGRGEVSRLTARVRFDDSSLSRGWRAEGRRPRPTYREAFDEVRGTMIRTVTLHVEDRLSFHLRREAGATFYAGSFAIFEDAVMGKLTQAASERRALLSDRTRIAHKRAETAIAVKVNPAPSMSRTHPER